MFCGRDAADEFGNGPTYSDARGAYRLDVTAPGLLYQPVDTGLVLGCRARAAGPPPGGPIADSTLRIRFMPTQAGLAPTIVDLRVRGQP